MAKKWIKWLSLSAVAMLLAACSQNHTLETLRHTTPKGTAFQNELAKLYLTYADVAQNYGDYDAATQFAQKGLAAAYGQDLEPEQPPAALQGEGESHPLIRQRQDIMELLDPEVKALAPVAAAGSVFFYDCMLDQYQSDGQTEEFTYCQEQLNEAIGDMQQARSTIIAEESLNDNPRKPTDPMERYLVYFALDDYHLNDSAQRTVKLLFEELSRQTGSTEIVVNGHTDTTGSDRYNTLLSNKRAETVKEMLVNLGMDASTIETFGFGETDLAIPTNDNVLQPENRRVEIVVN